MGIVLNAINQRKTKTLLSHLYVEFLKSKTKPKLIDTGNRWIVARGGEGGRAKCMKVPKGTNFHL